MANTIAKQYTRLLTLWPKDALRPNLPFTRAIEHHGQPFGVQPIAPPPEDAPKPKSPAATTRAASSPPPNPKLEQAQVNALFSLLENRYSTKYALSPGVLKPTSAPEHYTKLMEEIERAPHKTCMLDTVAIRVGTEGSMYTVHSAVLRKRSNFFASAMKPEWSGSNPSRPPIDLTDEDPAIFEIYVHWLYFRVLPTTAEDLDNTEVDFEFCTLSKCYVLGEKLMDTAFKNAIIDAFTEAKFETPHLDLPSPGVIPVTIIYDGTPKNSPARRLMIKMWSKYATADWAPLLEDMPSEFNANLFRAVMIKKRASRDKIDANLYYEHGHSEKS
ncbi:hypothetical protein yc1106_00492 [Curvularia clavata]|uniref:BTB domain-containing protein n=1 Tax=Curvularia clavata TaxID=95742 RepID=A0A9Q8Z3E1_CURCL|nr:hypothetical protein yc1106_00492 [Curvularia clavata]